MDAKSHRAGVPAFLSSDRIASLSDTMFGVAMTLVVTTMLPAIQAHKGSAFDMLPAMSGELFTVVLSFAISARYWQSQQQRLAITRSVTPFQAWLHLLFLFFIVLVPITTSLDGLTGSNAQRGSVVIYGTHLILLALLNMWLWIEVHRTVAAHLQIAKSATALVMLAVALAVGAVRPDLTLYFWFAVFASPMLGSLLMRRLVATGDG
jgi:uncharacterized membrane protein